LTAHGVTGDDAYGVSPSFRQGVAEMGLWYLLDVPQNTSVWPEVLEWTTPEAQGRGRRPHARPLGRQEARERTQALPKAVWREITVAEGAQGPRTYRFAAERVRESLDGEPGAILWLIHRENLDGSEPRWYSRMLPKRRRWKRWREWRRPAGPSKPSSRPARVRSDWTSMRPGVMEAGTVMSRCAF
jgi:hypothetical protein